MPHLAVCIKVELKGRGLERGSLLGLNELLLGSLLLLWVKGSLRLVT